jgi:predicted signal transduction protein with EAL and GGDEF domain
VAVYPDDGKSRQELISNADQALYAVKHSGRNRTVCHGEIARAKDAPTLACAAG